MPLLKEDDNYLTLITGLALQHESYKPKPLSPSKMLAQKENSNLNQFVSVMGGNDYIDELSLASEKPKD